MNINRASFFTQNYNPKYNPTGSSHTEDCGPCSLAMALCSLGFRTSLAAYAERVCRDAQELIDSARFAMFSVERQPTDSKKCVFRKTESGEWSVNASARLTLTNLVDLELAAANCGCSTERVGLDILERPRIPALILAGDPSLQGAFGPRLGVNYQGGHFIFLPAQEVAENLRIHDPLSPSGPAMVSKNELECFLAARPFEDAIGLRLGNS